MTSKTTTRLRAATRRCKPAQLATCVDAVIVTLTLGTYLLTAAPLRADEITLVESGSTLIYPLFNVWAIEYTKTHPGVRIVTNATGSEQGINQAISGAANIGTSDAYMSDAEIRRNPQIINVAMAISAQTVNYNLPGFNGAALKLDGPVLAGIYAGRIRAWDDKAIAALNLGLALPHHDIIPVRRADGAGDTFVFTQYLSFTTRWWEEKFYFGRSIAWPDVAGALTATGNSGMLETLQRIPYSIVLYRRELLQRDRESATWYRTAKKPFWRVFAPDAGDDPSGGGSAHPADASGPAAHLGQRAGRPCLSSHQLRICRRFHQASESRDCWSNQAIPSLGDRTR